MPIVGIFLGEALLYGAVVHDQALLRVSLLVHLLAFLGCVVAPLRDDQGGDIGSYFVVALVPMTRFVAIGLPALSSVSLFQLTIVYAILVPALLLVTEMESTPNPRPYWDALFVVGPFFLPLAVVLGALQFVAFQPAAFVPSAAPAWLFLAGTFFLFVVGPVEELLFRGLLQEGLETELGRRGSILLSSGLYGAAHSQYGSPGAVAVAVVAGLLFGWLYARSGSLGLVAVLNGVMGFCTFVAIPLWV